MASSGRRNGLDHTIQITVPDEIGILTPLETAGMGVAQEWVSPVDDPGVFPAEGAGQERTPDSMWPGDVSG